MSRLPVTGTGAGLAALTVVGYALGVLLGYSVLVALATGTVTVLAAAACFVAVRPSVTLTREITPDRTSVGEPALGRIHVRNTARRPCVAFTAVDRVGPQTIALDVRTIAPGGLRAVNYPLPAPRRGRITLGPLTVERRDPFGLFRWARRQTSNDVLWVHPRIHPMRALPVGIVLDYEGRTHENARLGTVTFSALREYVPGDDPRQIHWRSTARLGTLMVREHIDTMEPTTTVVLDTRTDAFDDASFEEAVEVAASVVRTVENTGRPVALHIVGEPPDAEGGSPLDRLSLAGRHSNADLLRFLATVDRDSGGGALVVVTGRAEAGLLTRLAGQRRRYRPVVVVSLPGASAPAEGGVRRRPGTVVLTARSAAEAAIAWNRMIGGDAG